MQGTTPVTWSSPPTTAFSGDADDRDEDDDTDEDPGEWLAAPEACEAPGDLPADPVARTRHAVPGFAHVIDAAYSEADNQFYVAGIPALTGWMVTDSGLVETVRYDMGTAIMSPSWALGVSR